MQAMDGRLDGTASRVPVPTGSVTDFFTAQPKKDATTEAINEVFQAAGSEGRFSKVVDCSDT